MKNLKIFEKGQYRIKNTIGMFDLLKGVVLLMVMLAHTYGLYDGIKADSLLSGYLIGFLKIFGETMMPVLFMLSGYGFRKTTFKKCVKKQAELLLRPYAVTGAASAVLAFFSFYFRYRYFREAVKKALWITLGFLLGIPKTVEMERFTLSWCGPVWFLMAMFISLVVFNELLGRFSGKKLLAMAFVSACLGWGLSFIKHCPWCISQGLVAALYVCIGYFAKKEKIFTEKLTGGFRTIAAIIATILFSLFLSQFGNNNMADSDYAFGPLSIIASCLLGIAIIYMFLRLNRFDGRVYGFLRNVGRYSLYILCIHTIEFMSFGGILQMDFVNVYKGSVSLRSLIIFLVRTIVVYMATKGYVWMKARYMDKYQREEQK